jgi:hypothetical protein
MISGPPPTQSSQALWPWIVMPAVVLIVFCILHYDIRPLGRGAATSASPSSGALTSEPTAPRE